MLDDYQKYRVVMDILQLLMLASVTVYTWIVNRTKANTAAIDEVKTEQRRVANKVDLLENDIAHLPNHGDLEKLHEKVNSVANTLKTVEGELAGVNRNLSLIMDALMRGKS